MFQRDAYLQRRRNLVYDGQPPRERESEEKEPEKEPAKEPEKEPGKDKPVNPSPRSSVDNVFLPRIPRNYEAVKAAGYANSR